jgi:hypothetical protein
MRKCPRDVWFCLNQPKKQQCQLEWNAMAQSQDPKRTLTRGTIGIRFCLVSVGARPHISSAQSRCLGVFHLEPLVGAAGTISRAKALRHDAVAAEGAGVLVDHRAVAVIGRVDRDILVLFP